MLVAEAEVRELGAGSGGIDGEEPNLCDSGVEGGGDAAAFEPRECVGGGRMRPGMGGA